MSSKDIVAAWEASMQRGYGEEPNFDAVLSYLSPDVEVIEASSLPYAGIYRGHDGFRRLATVMNATWEFPPGKNFDYVAEGDRVVVLTLGRAIARATGIEIEWRLAELCVLSRGLIAQIRPFYWDTGAVSAAIRGTSPS